MEKETFLMLLVGATFIFGGFVWLGDYFTPSLYRELHLILGVVAVVVGIGILTISLVGTLYSRHDLL